MPPRAGQGRGIASDFRFPLLWILDLDNWGLWSLTLQVKGTMQNPRVKRPVAAHRLKHRGSPVPRRARCHPIRVFMGHRGTEWRLLVSSPFMVNKRAPLTGSDHGGKAVRERIISRAV